MSIQRYDNKHVPYLVAQDDGAFVLYKDHLDAMELQRVYLAESAVSSGGYAEGYDAGVQAAREAVERASTFFKPLGPALAAIDALKEKLRIT